MNGITGTVEEMVELAEKLRNGAVEPTIRLLQQSIPASLYQVM
ncbi:hypothetical protein ACFLVF_02500 [Chloroflexota bacterium]